MHTCSVLNVYAKAHLIVSGHHKTETTETKFTILWQAKMLFMSWMLSIFWTKFNLLSFSSGWPFLLFKENQGGKLIIYARRQIISKYVSASYAYTRDRCFWHDYEFFSCLRFFSFIQSRQPQMIEKNQIYFFNSRICWMIEIQLFAFISSLMTKKK